MVEARPHNIRSLRLLMLKNKKNQCYVKRVIQYAVRIQNNNVYYHGSTDTSILNFNFLPVFIPCLGSFIPKTNFFVFWNFCIFCEYNSRPIYYCLRLYRQTLLFVNLYITHIFFICTYFLIE